MDIWKYNGPSIEPCGTAASTETHEECFLFVTIPCFCGYKKSVAIFNNYLIYSFL